MIRMYFCCVTNLLSFITDLCTSQIIKDSGVFQNSSKLLYCVSVLVLEVYTAPVKSLRMKQTRPISTVVKTRLKPHKSCSPLLPIGHLNTWVPGLVSSSFLVDVGGLTLDVIRYKVSGNSCPGQLLHESTAKYNNEGRRRVTVNRYGTR